MPERPRLIAGEVISPVGGDLERTFAAMREGRSGVRPLARLAGSSYLADIGGEIPQAVEHELRDADGDQTSPRAFFLASHVGRATLSAARATGVDFELGKTALIVSTTKAEIGEVEKGSPGEDPTLDGLSNPFVFAQRLASTLEAGGPSFCVSCACASGLVAIRQAARLILRGAAPAVLVVGVDLLSDFVMRGFSSLMALSKQPCRPYDADRSGMSLGEGAGALLMVRDAPELTAYPTVAGWAISNDAINVRFPDPHGESLGAAITAAIARAEIAPEEIGFINGHGTATDQNDAMEMAGILAAFKSTPPPLCSLKGYIGHSMGAAGVIEAVISLEAMKRRVLPASLGFARLRSENGINILRQWREVDEVKSVLTLKNGFGGINAALVLRRGVGA